MEIFLNLWDELDDLVGACRHIATSMLLKLPPWPAATVLLTAAAAPLGWLLRLKNLI